MVDECSFLADTLELPWLKEAVDPIPESLKSDPTEALLLTQQIISQLRIDIDQYLVGVSANLIRADEGLSAEPVSAACMPRDCPVISPTTVFKTE